MAVLQHKRWIERLSLSWRTYIINMRLFHLVHWDISDGDYLHVSQRCTHIKARSPVHINPVVFRILLWYREGEQKQKANGPCLVQPSNHSPLTPDWDAFSNKGFPSPAQIPMHISIICYWIFFFWLWQHTTKVEYTGHKRRVFYAF